MWNKTTIMINMSGWYLVLDGLHFSVLVAALNYNSTKNGWDQMEGIFLS